MFYRMLEAYNPSCSNESDHVYHFNTSSLADSIEFYSENFIHPHCSEQWHRTEKYIFTVDHPDSSFVIRSIIGGLSGGYYFQVNEEHTFDLNIGNPLGVSFDKNTNHFILTTPFRNLVIKAKSADDLYTKQSFRYSPSDTAWNNYRHVGDLPDSLFIDFSVLGINPYHEGYYVGIKDSNIVMSSDHGNTFEILTAHPLEEGELFDAKFSHTFFDVDSSSFYITFKEGYNTLLVRKAGENWSFKELSAGSQSHRFAIDYDEAGNFYFSTNDSLLHSSDYGESSTLIDIFPDEITGLYKKPDSDILYVLTREELLEVNTSTKEITTLKELPVSNERYPAGIPNQITLHQNYPNPFNPSTVISYQLSVNSLVQLEVFDITGRKVAVLVDGVMKTAGNHQVIFDAAALASGMYFYQLKTAGQTLTQKMMLVK